jgi:methionine-S-sulfoxide reductase
MSSNSTSQTPYSPPPLPAGEELATFAGGCFWCIESGFESLPGLSQSISGYAGGSEINPTYEEVAGGKTGHAETVQVYFNHQVTSYQELLDLFFRYIDPTDASGQYVDRGPQYRTIIFYHSDTQKELAEQKIKALSESGRYDQPIVTTVEPYINFFPAEEYHQDYYKKAPERYQQYKDGSGRAKDL